MPERPTFDDCRFYASGAVSARPAPLGAVLVEMNAGSDPPYVWHAVELSGDDAVRFAASLLADAGYGKHARRVLKKLDRDAA